MRRSFCVTFLAEQVFQKREDGRISFDADFHEFARGFGEVSGDYWLGNYALRNMTDPKFGQFELRVDLWDWSENHRYAKYQEFTVTGDDFTLGIGEYSGDAGRFVASMEPFCFVLFRRIGVRRS